METCRRRELQRALILGILLSAGCRSPGIGRSSADALSHDSRIVRQTEITSTQKPQTGQSPSDVEQQGLQIQLVSQETVLAEPAVTGTSGDSSSDPKQTDLMPDNSIPTEVGQSETMPLNHLCAIAVSSNPDLVTLRQTERVSVAAKGVAETYPFNPFLQIQATPIQDVRNGSPNNMYHYVLLMQTIQLAHQQGFREQGARCTLNSTRWNIHQAELLTLAQTQRLYFTSLYQRGIQTLAEASHNNNLQLLGILEKQLNAGAATAADVAIVRVDAASTRQQQTLATANYRNALRDLARYIGMQPNALPEISGDLHQFRWQLPGHSGSKSESDAEGWDYAVADSVNAVAEWAKSRPDVMAARSDVDVSRANLGLASASKTPDLQIGPYYQATADSSTFLGFRAQMDLPVFNNGVPLERQRLAEYHQRITAWSQAQKRAELEAEAAIDRYATALAVVQSETSKDTSSDLPSELSGLEKQFLAGEVDVVRVVQARNSLILNRRARLDLLNELSQSAANLIAATGIPVETIVQMDVRKD